MKILVILTGGTIGSAISEGFISLDGNSKSTLISEYSHLDIDTLQPYHILSEQLDGEYLTALTKCIEENLDKNYDGIIVTHGTDTLQYTACGLSCRFSDSPIPIILVSSNYVLTDKRANGKDNFKYAIKFIEEKIGGVFVSYRNAGDIPKIHQGHQVLPHEIYSDDVNSIDGAFGYFEDEKFIQNNPLEKIDTFSNGYFEKISPVLWLKIHPGMKFPSIENYKTILLEAYHSGTAPTLSEEFRSFCINANIPIYLVGAKEGPQYDSVKEYEELNIKHLPFISPIYAYMCLWFLTSNKIDFNSSMENPIF